MIYVRLDRDFVTVVSEQTVLETNKPDVRWVELDELLGRPHTENDVKHINIGDMYDPVHKRFIPNKPTNN